MNKCLCLLLLLCQPMPADSTFGGQPTDPEIKNLEWNRYTAGNFTILSIDDAQGRWLKDNIEQIKNWSMSRWGFPDVRFSKECRIFCAPSKSVMKKLFGIEQSKMEIRKKDGRYEMTALWLLLDDKPSRTVPPSLTMACLSDFESTHNVNIGWWFKRGASQLNGSLSDIRGQMAALSSPVFTSGKMFSMTEEEYLKESPENRAIYDRQAAALCLLLRQEFGEAKLQGFLRISSRNGAEDVLRMIYGFQGFEHFDRSYSRFMRDINREVLGNKTPDSYLEIKPVRRN